MDSVDWLLLQTLYEQQNITKAAETLFLSQPALSYRIQQLEKEFGVVIIQRGKKKSEFTPQGEYLYRYFQEMLTQLQTVKEKLLSMNQKVSGTLKIGSTGSLTKNLLPEILEEFHTHYSEVEFKLNSGLSNELINMVYKQEIHIGFVRGEAKWNGERQLLMEENISVVSDKKIQLSELPNLPMIVYSTEASLKNVIDVWWKDMYTKPPNITMSVDKMETAIEMVVHGLGYAILPNIVLRHIKNLYLLPLKTKNGKNITRQSWIVYRQESLAIPMIRVFVGYVVDYMHKTVNTFK